MNKTAIFQGTREKHRGFKSLHFDFSSRNKTKMQRKKI